jgi:hypothetical protein
MFPSKVADSPTVSLERGDYRMRAPPRRPPPVLLFQEQARPAPRSQRQDVTRNITLLLLFLAIATLSCFGAAYYLFAKRWAHRTVSPHPSETNASHQANATAFIDQLRISPDEKYLSYLPHSGFHNQRIAFENALVLAFALRRTLLVPPIRLANKPIRYVEFDTLVRHHELSSKLGLQHCPQVPSYLSRPLECLEYFESSYLPWSLLVDLSLPLIQLPNVSQRWLREHLCLKENDIYTLKDRSPYQFRFLDTNTDSSSTSDRYAQDVYFSDLSAVNTRLIQLGTLFGTSRLRLKDPTNLAYQRSVRHSMIFINQDLSQVADSIAISLNHHFLAVHIRIGDGSFKADAERSVKSIWWTLLKDVLGFSPAETCRLQAKFSGLGNLNCSKEFTCTRNCSLFTTVPTVPFPVSRVTCRSPRHHEGPFELLNIPLYVATDLRHPESDHALHLLRRTFPCIFFLTDFTRHIRQLKSVTSPYDGVQLQPFLLPFIDAMVAAKALAFVGTQGSTFSKFVTTLWHFYHDPGPIPN